MDPAHQQFGQEFAARIIARDYTADEGSAIDAWFDLWMILAEDGGKLSIGYFELTDPD